MSDRTVFEDAHIMLNVVAVLVKRLGGEVKLSQEDFDDVAFGRLLEDHGETLVFRLVEPTGH